MTTMNGNVQKVKNLKKSLKTNKKTSKVNSIKSKNQTVSPKTGLCFVKLRRTSYNTNINNNNTLQAQCKVNKNLKIEMEVRSVDEASKKIDSVVGKAKTTNREIQNAEEEFVRQVLLNDKTKNNSKSKTNNTASAKTLSVGGNNETNRGQITEKPLKRCCIKLRRTALDKSKQGRKKPEAGHVKNKRVEPKTKCNTEKPSTSSIIKRCVVKLKKTSITLKTKATAIEPSTPRSIRKCVVKLKKNPVAAKTRDIEIVPTTPSRECVVILQRTQLLQTNDADGAYTDTLTSSCLSTIPVIDKSKRDNFRKLCLTKSLRKSLENKENDSELSSKIEDCQQKTKLESKTKEIPKNNNTVALTTNNLKAHKCIKRGILSLRRQKLKNNKNLTTNLEVTQFEPQHNSTIRFQPVRNSTLLEFGFTKDNYKEISKEKSMEDTSSKDRSSSQNLANKFNEIENILNSLDEDDEILLKSPDTKNKNEVEKNYESQNENDNNAETQRESQKKMLTLQQDPKTNDVNIVETQNNISSSKNQTNKFFHRKKEDPQGNILKDVSDPKITSTTTPKAIEITKKHRFLTKRSTITKRDNVYEFLSQSQTSDSDGTSKHQDPTADIIKKLIEQGKVRVATNCKGKGKPKFKRKVPPKRMKKIKQGNKNLKQLKNKATVTKLHEIIDDELEVEHIDDFENYESTPDDYDMENERPEVGTEKLNLKNINQPNDQEGTFSRLARTVLINEAGRLDLHRKNASLLLQKVRKYVSTPKNKQMPTTQTVLEADLSPILMPPLETAKKASPWRVNEDAYLPRTFNFARSSGNLPSFSSDFIPSTPSKEKPKNRVIMQEQTSITSHRFPVISDQNSNQITPLQSPLHNAVENIEPNINAPSVLSSFSSNDSNAENMSPPRPTLEKNNENENIFDLKQLPNPRRAFNYRSPLKTINILEVLHLPPYKNAYKIPNTKQYEAVEMFSFDKNLGEESLQADTNIEPINVSQQAIDNTKTKNYSKENLFGFEDFLSQTEFASQEHDGTNINESTTNEINQTIHDKLQNLRKLKPPENELQLSLLNTKALPLFAEESTNDNGMRQRCIKEMLCSTLINPVPSTSREALRQLKKTNWKYSERPNFDVTLDVSELFKDPEPETTFNETNAHRTYIRPYKRKRRLKQNKFVMFLDSDESDGEHYSGEQRKHQNSHETDTSSEKVPKKKRQRKEPKEKPELTEFVEEFNNMCKEVDSYELIVEKSA